MSTTTIHANGSKWHGQPPDPLSVLLDVLRREPLDPRFPHARAGFAENIAHGAVKFWGNFYELSHCFDVDTDDPVVIALLAEAIRANRESAAYKAIAREVKS